MSIKLFLICVWSVGVFSVRAAVPVEGIIYFKEGKSVGFSGDHRVCIPKKGKDVKAFRGIFTRDKQKEIYPAEGIDSIVCWHPRALVPAPMGFRHKILHLTAELTGKENTTRNLQ